VLLDAPPELGVSVAHQHRVRLAIGVFNKDLPHSSDA
jgi:hypothetical protein